MDKMALMMEKTRLLGEIRSLREQLGDLNIELETHNVSKESTLTSMKESFIASETASIDTTYREHIQELVDKQTSLEDEIDTLAVDESDESVTKLKEKREYLNQVAIEVDKLLAALVSVSNDYFISLAFTSKTFTYKRYIKELKRVDIYIRDIEAQRHKETISLKFKDTLRNFLSENISIWIAGVFAGAFSVLAFPYVFYRALGRAKKLHNHSKRYHMMVQTSFKLSDETAQDIIDMLDGVLITRKNTLEDQLQEVIAKLEKMLEEKQAKIDEIYFDEEKALFELEEQCKAIQQDIDNVTEKLKEAEDMLAEVVAQLDELMGELYKATRLEREPYINPENPVRSVTFPGRFLFKYSDEKNSFNRITPGLYIYNSREHAEGIIRSFVFQMRNYMRWGALKIYVMDVLMGLYVSDMQLHKNSDLIVDSMKEDHSVRIDLLHDMMSRRRVMVKQVAQDLNGYNTVQIAAGSSPMSFEIAIYFLESPQTLTEKMIQLLKIGESLGIYIMLLINREQLTVENVRMYEKYVGNIIEFSSNGVTITTPSIFRETFEEESKNRS